MKAYKATFAAFSTGLGIFLASQAWNEYRSWESSPGVLLALILPAVWFFAFGVKGLKTWFEGGAR